MHPSIPSLRAKLREVGDVISREGTPKCLDLLLLVLLGESSFFQLLGLLPKVVADDLFHLCALRALVYLEMGKLRRAY